MHGGGGDFNMSSTIIMSDLRDRELRFKLALESVRWSYVLNAGAGGFEYIQRFLYNTDN